MRQDLGPVSTLSSEDLALGLADGSILVVDVREPHETRHGVIPGSVLMPLSRFDPGRLPVGQGRRVVFSCAAGVRSVQALAVSQAAGVDLSEHFGGGFKGWAAEGRPVEHPVG